MDYDPASLSSLTFKSKEDVDLPSLLLRDSKSLRKFCDVTINVGSHEITAHRVILAAHSNYFDKRFKNDVAACREDGYVLEIEVLDWMVVKEIVDFIYTSNITVNGGNVYDLIVAADYFQMPEVKKFCLEFLETFLCSSNCLKTLEFARSRNIESLTEKAWEYLYDNFKYVVRSQYFKQLKLEEMHEVIRPPEAPPVKICESLIFEAIVVWVKENTYRAKNFVNLLKLIPLGQLKLSYLANVVADEELVKSSLPALQLVVEAIRSHCGEKTKDETQDERLSSQELFKKLINQHERFVQYFKDDPGDCWFVVSSQWLKEWVQYVTNGGYDWNSEMRLPRHPGPIDNSSLFTNKSYKMLKTSVKPQEDYKFVPESVWWALVDWYGIAKGQPAITERGIVSNDKSSIYMEGSTLLVDPILLQFGCMNMTIEKTFSQWDLLSHVEADMRKSFKIPQRYKVTLSNGNRSLNLTKSIKENNLINNKIKIKCLPSSSSGLSETKEIIKHTNSKTDSKKVLGVEVSSVPSSSLAATSSTEVTALNTSPVASTKVGKRFSKTSRYKFPDAFCLLGVYIFIITQVGVFPLYIQDSLCWLQPNFGLKQSTTSSVSTGSLFGIVTTTSPVSAESSSSSGLKFGSVKTSSVSTGSSSFGSVKTSSMYSYTSKDGTEINFQSGKASTTDDPETTLYVIGANLTASKVTRTLNDNEGISRVKIDSERRSATVTFTHAWDMKKELKRELPYLVDGWRVYFCTFEKKN